MVVLIDEISDRRQTSRVRLVNLVRRHPIGRHLPIDSAFSASLRRGVHPRCAGDPRHQAGRRVGRRTEAAFVNGAAALLADLIDGLYVFSGHERDGKIVTIRSLLNPEKLGDMDDVAELR